jgi:hypothetical protein
MQSSSLAGYSLDTRPLKGYQDTVKLNRAVKRELQCYDLLTTMAFL